jgi:hypothetical protein
VIAVFTKYDQFRRNVQMKLEDQGSDTGPELLNAEVEKVFNEQYLANLTGSPPVVCLESENFVNEHIMYYANSCLTGMHRPGQQCTELIEKTANGLSESVVVLMLLAVQKHNLELSMREAVRR